MEIHPPEGPAHSFRDFAIHIGIVTIGILIALGLEGIRESWREHRSLAEARERFVVELKADQRQLQLERARVRDVNRGLQETIETLLQLTKDPATLQQKIAQLSPSFYFFSTTAWDTAVATGVLTHMDASELDRFANVYQSVKNYQDAEKMAVPNWIAVTVFFQARKTLAEPDVVAGAERLRTLQVHMQELDHLGQEFQEDLSRAALQ